MGGADVVAVTLPRRRSLLGKAVDVVSAGRKPGAVSRISKLAAVAREHVVTIAALASVDLGAFHASQVAGWIVTGVCLLVADFAVRG